MFGGQGTAGGGFNFTPAASSTGSAAGSGFSFGAASTAGTTPSTGFSFGAAPSTTTTAAAAGGGFSFGNSAASTGGGGGSGFTGFGGLGASTAPSTAITGSAGLPGFNFGAAAATKPNMTVAAPSSSTGFGMGAATTTSTAPTGGGFSFGGGVGGGGAGFTGLGGNAKPSLPAATTTNTAAAGGISFGSTAAKSTSGGTSLISGLLNTSSTQPPSLSTASTTTTVPAAGFSLGASTVPAASSASSGFSFGTSIGQPAAATTTASTSLGGGGLGLAGFAASTASAGGVTTSSTLASGQKQMTFRQLEDTINKWTTELEDQEKCFLDQATQVNAWDRIVMENGEKIIQLNKDLERVKLDQQKLDHELDFVHSQQRELEELLTPLESALNELPPISHTQHAQLEREHTYTLAESLDSQLKRMSQDLKEIVERLNSTNIKPDDNDPLQQVTKILNAHVVSLMWVDRNSANLQRRAEEIAKMMDLEKKEQERNFRMAYS